MTANKDPAASKWIARFRYTTWDGQQKQSMKRGFNTRRDALQWEREFLLSKAGSNEMSFGHFLQSRY